MPAVPSTDIVTSAVVNPAALVPKAAICVVESLFNSPAVIARITSLLTLFKAVVLNCSTWAVSKAMNSGVVRPAKPEPKVLSCAVLKFLKISVVSWLMAAELIQPKLVPNELICAEVKPEALVPNMPNCVEVNASNCDEVKFFSSPGVKICSTSLLSVLMVAVVKP